MYYWNQQRIKELKERGYKLKFYDYDPRLKDQPSEEQEDQSPPDTEDNQK